MFANIQPMEGPPRLINVNHIIQLTGETVKFSDGTTVRLSAESVLRLHHILPKVEE